MTSIQLADYGWQEPEDDRQLRDEMTLLGACTEFARWSEFEHASESPTFDEWLDTPAGKAWLDEEVEFDRFLRTGSIDRESWDFIA
jgi:hypothetical protein